MSLGGYGWVVGWPLVRLAAAAGPATMTARTDLVSM